MAEPRGGGIPHPQDFGRSVNSIWTKRVDYTHHITTCNLPSQIFRPSAIPVLCYLLRLLFLSFVITLIWNQWRALKSQRNIAHLFSMDGLCIWNLNMDYVPHWVKIVLGDAFWNADVWSHLLAFFIFDILKSIKPFLFHWLQIVLLM